MGKLTEILSRRSPGVPESSHSSHLRKATNTVDYGMMAVFVGTAAALAEKPTIGSVAAAVGVTLADAGMRRLNELDPVVDKEHMVEGVTSPNAEQNSSPVVLEPSVPTTRKGLVIFRR